MRRTQMRPLPSGRLTPAQALWFGVAFPSREALELGFGVNWLCSALGTATLMMYLFLYTPLKQKTWWSTTVGAFPGAMPPLIGFAAAANSSRRKLGYSAPFFSCGSSRIFTPSPGCIERITRAPAFKCCRLLSPTANRQPARSFSIPSC